jgi:hypothetical protein
MPISSALGSSALLPAGLGFRNIVINGGFDVWQRGTSGAFTTTVLSSFQADRWSCYRSVTGADATQSRVSSGLDGFQYALRMQRNSGTTGTQKMYIGTSFETSTATKLINKPVVLSFYARAGSNYSPASNAFEVLLQSGTGTEVNGVYTGFTSGTNVINTTATLTTSWQRFIYYGVMPAISSQLLVQFAFNSVGTAGANDYADITGVQLEQNYQPTPFEQRPYGVEDFLCKRYYQKWGNSSNTSFMTIGSGIYSTPLTLASPMRAVNNTSVTYVATIYGNGTSYAINSLGVSIFDSANPQYFRLEGSFSGSWNYSWPLCTFNTHNVIINSEL